jgi:MFS family permease
VRLIGGAMSGNGSVIQGYIADVTPPDRRSGRMALLGVAFNVGFIVGPFVGGQLAHPSGGRSGSRSRCWWPRACRRCRRWASCCSCGRAGRARDADDHASRWKMLGYAVTEPVISRLMLLTFLSGCAFFGMESVFGLWGEARFEWGPKEIGRCSASSG